MNIIDNDLLSVQEARILCENAHEAQDRLSAFSQEKLDEISEAMLQAVEQHIDELANLSYEETEIGNVEDKKVKIKIICQYLREKFKNLRCVGIIGEDKENKTIDIGVPVGTVVAFCPSTSPVSTTIYKTLISIKSGNTIIFSPHLKARKVISKTLDIMIKAAEKHSIPDGAISYLHTVTKMGSVELMNHKYTSIIMNTGVPDLLQDCYNSGKPVIYGCAGNGPAFIEKTADIKQAVKNIIDSKAFDYGVMAGTEQCVVVDSCIAKEVETEMIENGAYFMTEEESQSLGKLLYDKYGRIESDMVGKPVQFIAKRAGFSVNDSVRVLVLKQKFVSEDNLYAKQKLSSVLAYYIENDWMHACEKCIELLLTERTGHTLIIHSKDEEVIKLFALKKPVGRVLVNTPGAFGSMGATTNLFPSMTLGSGSAGKGMTSDNVSPLNLIYIRKVGYGVRDIDDIINKNECQLIKTKNNNETNVIKDNMDFNNTIDIKALSKMLVKILENN